MTELRPQHLQTHYAKVLSQGRIDGKGGLSPRNVQYQHRILSESLSHAVKMGILVRNVADVVDAPRLKRRGMTTMAFEGVPKFLRASQETSFHEVYCTALFTGMRLGELLGLRWCDVDLELATLYVSQALYKRRGVCKIVEPKTSHSRRSVAMPPALAILLRQHRAQQEAKRILVGKSLKETDLVFAYADGSPLDPGTVTHTFTKVLAMAGLPHIRFHDLSHTHATLPLKAGVLHPQIVQERLGHSSIAVMTVDTYSHITPGLQEMVAQRIEAIIGAEAMEVLGIEKSGERMLADVVKMLSKGGSLSVSRTGIEPVTC